MKGKRSVRHLLVQPRLQSRLSKELERIPVRRGTDSHFFYLFLPPHCPAILSMSMMPFLVRDLPMVMEEPSSDWYLVSPTRPAYWSCSRQ